jgi:hypothetical protein
MTVYTASFLLEWKPAGSWVDITASIAEVSGDLELSGNTDNALSFGDASDLRCSVKTDDLTLQATAYLDVPIRFTPTISGVTVVAFTGIIAGRDRDQTSLTFACEGYQRLIARTRAYSVARYRRVVATATTVASVEDPDDVAYVGGLINEALWRAGGRPLEQDFTYTTALFYYSVPEDAILAPEWSWLAGENAWDECLKLARASGGQLYQSADGVVRYLQPLSFGSGTATYTFADTLAGATNRQGVYGDLTEQGTGDLVVTKVMCSFVPRQKQGIQEVINDTTPRLIPALETTTITLEAQNPLASLLLSGGTLPFDAVKATFLDGRPVVAGDLDITVTLKAQQITLAVENTSANPIAIHALILQGEPIVAGEAGTASAGSGTGTLTIPDNPYIQSQAHAERLCEMVLAFHGTTLPLRSATGCVYDPARSVGETVSLTCSRWSLSAVAHLITAKRHSDTGMEASYDLVPVVGLPKSADFFIVGSTSYTGLSRKLGF